MKKYKFSLDNVLNWRELQEEEAKKTFLIYQQAQKEQEEILNEYKEASQAMNESTESLTNINKLRQQFVYKNFLDNQIVKQQATVDQYSNETSKKMSVFVDAQKERKIMERLKEKHYNNYLLQEKSEEQKELDEMGTLRFSYSFL
ncbi:flagellar export protein FliJ [Vagococcus carniphilus]|uniref:Flagellar FliJ protein n=1 Tax=Vagococcus carniphilus TaxID=218144 RepID=A0AAW8U2D2_9ENTE|nr:flagellar export protein FliJ [Vagococcus carniphilus]MDT2829615.1 flagellar export protein FliJ [Vagococcus carniphilus]MDT2833683.1 flagellar export protein FliJ [Vagococcus carniphilus]MDT2839074.1 flagellar export protein FliJ [Vagococcus carniphilus]MDT2847636.1 flagellar export protein FliJ [Vagococcus carniphilus]MDT2853132.1 flagellar export protein FliJ [Vagococcus carniphilus]